MTTYQKVQEQLKRLHINCDGWGHGEYKELCNILHHDEVIEAAVNGYYEAGFALLVVTKNRLLIVDKKPLNYLTVEDMRYDMINEFDYQHRFVGAQLKVSAGAKTLHFTSLNQVGLRRCMTYVQNRMTQIKEEASSQQEEQQKHLEQMNKQLEMYLKLQQLQQQQVWQQQPQPPYTWQQQHLPTQHYAGQMVGPPNTVITDSQRLRDMTPQELGVAAMKRVLPVIGAYTRLPMMSQRRRYQSTPAQH